MQPEQKSVSWMKDVSAKFKKGGQVVVVLCTGAFSVTKAFMKLPKYRRFFGCEIDALCSNGLLLSVVEMFAPQLLSNDSGIEDSAEVVAAAHTNMSAMNGIQARRNRLMWYAPAGLPAMQ